MAGVKSPKKTHSGLSRQQVSMDVDPPTGNSFHHRLRGKGNRWDAEWVDVNPANYVMSRPYRPKRRYGPRTRAKPDDVLRSFILDASQDPAFDWPRSVEEMVNRWPGLCEDLTQEVIEATYEVLS